MGIICTSSPNAGVECWFSVPMPVLLLLVDVFPSATMFYNGGKRKNKSILAPQNQKIWYKRIFFFFLNF